mgnify:FL=1
MEQSGYISEWQNLLLTLTSFCTTVMERKATRKENKEMDENKVIVSTEMKQTLVNLRNLEEIYVIMSG